MASLDFWITVFVAISALIYWYLKWPYSYWAKKGVPFEDPSLVLGNMSDVVTLKKSFGECVDEFYRKYDGFDYVGMYRFRDPVLLVRSPELIKNILVKDFPSFSVNNFPVDEKLDALVAKSPFITTGDRWKVARQQLSPAFTPGKLKPLFPNMVEICKDFVKYIDREAPKHRPDGMDAMDVAARFTTENIANCTFGIRAECFTNPNAKLREMGQATLEPSFWNNVIFMTTWFFPFVKKIFKIKIIRKEHEDFFTDMIRDVISHRQKDKVKRNDFLEMLLQIKDKGGIGIQSEHEKAEEKEKFAYTEEDVMGHCMTFFTEGYFTSAITTSFILYELVLHPEIQTKLRREIDEAVKKHGGILSYDLIQDVPYLDMVFQETLRLRAVGAHMEKTCTKDYNLPGIKGGTVTIEKGSVVIIPVIPLHHDPKYFENPMEFDPERFSEENKHNINRDTYLPFGDGPRQCLGMRFAQTQVKAGIIAILSHFELRKTPKTQETFIQDPTSPLTALKGGIWLDFVKRSDGNLLNYL